LLITNPGWQKTIRTFVKIKWKINWLVFGNIIAKKEKPRFFLLCQLSSTRLPARFLLTGRKQTE